MTTEPPDDQAIIAFLLGASSEEEAERLDELSVTDDKFARRVQAIEYDLVDSYTKGALPPEQLTRFQSHYLASPKRREKLSLAESFLAMVDTLADTPREAGETSNRRPGFLRNFSRSFAMGGPALQWGLAAALLVVVLTAAYLLFENQALRNEAARAGSERAALEEREHELEGQLADQRSSDAATERELARVRERLAELEQTMAVNHQQPDSAASSRVIAMNLSPQTRGIDQPPTITVTPGIESLALTLELEAAGFPAYRAALIAPATGQTIWRSGRLTVSGTRKQIAVSFRASLLTSQTYVLELSGISTNGVVDNVGSYTFRIAKRQP